MPYWEGGRAYAPWAQGYYSSWGGSDLLTGLLIGSVLSGPGGFFGGFDQQFGAVGDGDAGGLGDLGSDE